MRYKLENSHLDLKLTDNLNYLAAQEIEPLLPGAQQVTIDLTGARIVDSEGVILLYKIVSRGKKLRLKNPPGILEEIIPALGLQEVLQLDKLVI